MDRGVPTISFSKSNVGDGGVGDIPITGDQNIINMTASGIEFFKHGAVGVFESIVVPGRGFYQTKGVYRMEFIGTEIDFEGIVIVSDAATTSAFAGNPA